MIASGDRRSIVGRCPESPRVSPVPAERGSSAPTRAIAPDRAGRRDASGEEDAKTGGRGGGCRAGEERRGGEGRGGAGARGGPGVAGLCAGVVAPFAVEELFVRAAEVADFAPLPNLDDARCELSNEVAIVAHEDDGAAKRRKSVEKPLD